MKKYLPDILLVILILLVCTVIYGFSSQNSADSTHTSDRFTEMFLRIFVPDYEKLSDAEKYTAYRKANFIVRKAAHFTEYTVLGFLAVWILWRRKVHQFGLWAQLFGSFYAVTDEFHQLFLGTRSGRLYDVLIDSMGVFAGILLFCFCQWLRNRKEKNKNRKKI